VFLVRRSFLYVLLKNEENLSFSSQHSYQNFPATDHQPQPEFQPEPDSKLEELTVKKEANKARQRIAELVSQKPQDEVGEREKEGSTLPLSSLTERSIFSSCVDFSTIVEPSFSLSHAAAVNLSSEVIDSFEAQTVTYKQSIKNKIKSNEDFIKEANEEIAQCQSRIDELKQQILAKDSQATQLKDLYFKIEEVS